jgi:hypothetical protein
VVLSQSDIVPDDYGVLPEEWASNDYPKTETIRTGTNGKELVVVLPRAEWFLRAIQWAQALNGVLYELENS